MSQAIIAMRVSPCLEVVEVAATPAALRRAYLNSLAEPQEYYVETLVQSGRTFLVRERGETIGYAVINGETVVEFFLAKHVRTDLDRVLAAVFDETLAVRFLCKTFDPFMLAAAAIQPAVARTEGHLFRTIADPGFVADPAILAVSATHADIDDVLRIHGGFFDSIDEIRSYVSHDGLRLFRARNRGLLGCGVSKRVIADRRDFDIGMVVAPELRGKGLGSYIAAFEKDRCLSAGDRPVCGCAADNIASRRALESAGFRTFHRLIAFSY